MCTEKERDAWEGSKQLSEGEEWMRVRFSSVHGIYTRYRYRAELGC